MKDTLQEIKNKLAADSAISEEKKKELLGLLNELESEMGAAGKPEQMKNISSVSYTHLTLPTNSRV